MEGFFLTGGRKLKYPVETLKKGVRDENQD